FISLRDNPNRGGYHKIYNNTFVTPVANGQSAAILEDDTRNPSPGLNVKNNIFSNFNWAYDLRSTNHTIDYNNDHCIKDIGKWAGNFVGSFANWQALGLDVHGISASPGFVSSTDLHLAQNSPCIGKGTDLSPLVGTDIDGYVRPGPSGVSLGSYEYGSASPIPVVPAAPVLATPNSGATGVSISPVLSWNTVPGATSYSLQVSGTSTFATTIATQAGITATTFTVDGLSNNTTFFWRVNATNANGTGGWSSTGNFTTIGATLPCTIVLWWPGNGATGVVINPSLTWSADSGALSYALQVSTDPAFSVLTIHESGIAATDFEADGLSPATTYFWRVNATTTGGVSDWSPASGFITAGQAGHAFFQEATADNLVSIEAEHFSANIVRSGHAWEKVATTGFSGECAMQVLPNNVATINTGYALASPRMDYQVTFVKTGRHYIWVRGIGPSGGDDSYHAGIDGKASTTCDRISSFTTQWKWSKTDMDGRSAYFNVPTTGEHAVNVWMREDGFIIDKIVITTNSRYVPTGSGPAETRINGLGKEALPGNAVGIGHVPPIMDIYSCRNGVVQISLPFSGAYRLTIYALSGKKTGAFAVHSESAVHTAVSLKNRNLAQGYYLMQLSVSGAQVSRKIYVMK
ncbi:MAG: hypothetical protein JXA71_03395, partial [Chitinispirillaceae bacterium]|nr:hypothetical protein [Chitinispirillaceae bacterium]